MATIDDVLTAVRDWLKAEGAPVSGARVKVTLVNGNDAARLIGQTQTWRQSVNVPDPHLPDGVLHRAHGIEVEVGA